MNASSKGNILKVAVLFTLLITFGFIMSIGANAEAQQPAKKDDGAATTKKIDPTDPTSAIYLDTAGKAAGVGDPNKPAGMAYRVGRAWHPAALAGANLPKDKYGLIDWAKLVREKQIKPRHSLDPAEEEMPPLPMDVLIEAKGDFVDNVIFPHEMHTYWLKCEVCHPKIFVPSAGQNKMSMVEIAQGQWCGRCHGKIAFPLADCKRCHTSKKTAKK